MSAWRQRSVLVSIMVGLLGGAAAAEAGPSALTFSERLACQEAIERVYWKHRGGDSEAPFEHAVPQALLVRKVERTLRLSAALERYWGRPVEPRQLQAEVDRMARQTRRPRMLRELFDALDQDPRRIAECLARPAIVERLARRWYAVDDRMHGALQREIEAVMRARPGRDGMHRWGGSYREQTWELTDDIEPAFHDRATERMPAAEYDRRLRRLGELVGGSRHETSQSLPLRVPGSIHEDESGFSVVAVLDHGSGHVRFARVTWPKQSFDRWWQRVVDSTLLAATEIEAGDFVFRLPVEASASSCAEDTWAPVPSGAPYARFRHEAVWTGAEMLVWGGLGQDLLAVGSRYDPATDTWAPMSDVGAPAPREGHTLVWTGSEMIVWGGRDGSTSYDTGGRYDPLTDTWTPTDTGGAPSARADHTAVWTGNEMIVWGGGSGSSGPNVNTGARYDPLSDTWTPTSVAGSLPIARRGHTAVWTGSIMIVWGGGTDSGGRYDPATDSWLLTWLGGAPAARTDHSAVWTGDEMIIWGGVLTGFTGSASAGARYDPDMNRWTPMPDPGGFRRQYSTVWTGTEMIVWGGLVSTSGPVLDTGLRYNLAGNAWTPVGSGPRLPDARYDHAAVWTGTEMIVWGGRGQGVLGTGGRYDPSTDSWLPTGTGVGQPSGRRFHTAVWTGTEMIVWGGSFTFGSVGTGSAYDPATSVWTPTSDAGDVPSPRSQHTAVWTGTEMIVWGGGNITNSGGRYDPLTRTWTATAVDAMTPAPRDEHTAVWTGTEMIVWGGRGQGNNRLKTGGRYDPATDSWSPVSIGSFVPEARIEHTAVWTGTEMIVWGGGNITNSGGRYDPLTRTWTATAVDAMTPAARDEHTAVWTGTEMIVWGGRGQGNNRLNTGGRYVPATDSWSPTSTGPLVPEARIEHTAVWTGSEMIVWGGRVLGGVNDGGRYDPLLDAWTPTATSGPAVPSPRTLHAAVWTGTEMIVWGGSNLDVGGRYTPSTDSWVATAVDAGTPSPRTDLTAVWTGDEMIVWGGRDGTGEAVASGGRYEPASDSWISTSQSGTPASRYHHTAVWTGEQMLVWGGFPYDSGAAGYCASCTRAVWYRDADQDGFGDDSQSVAACRAVPGYRVLDGDCDDTSPAIRPGATESCNGVDDNCNGVIDDDVTGVDNDADGVRNACDNCREIPNSSQTDLDANDIGDACDADDGLVYLLFAPGSLLTWQAEVGHDAWNAYRGDLDVLRATGIYTQIVGANDLAAQFCDLASPSIADPAPVDPGAVAFYLVAGISSGIELDLGTDSSGAIRPNANPCP